MELGADAVLVNTAIAVSENPTETAKAFKMAVQAVRIAYNAKLASIKKHIRQIRLGYTRKRHLQLY